MLITMRSNGKLYHFGESRGTFTDIKQQIGNPETVKGKVKTDKQNEMICLLGLHNGGKSVNFLSANNNQILPANTFSSRRKVELIQREGTQTGGN